MENLKILLIDSLSDITIIKETLECLSIRLNLKCASSIPEALALIDGGPPDLILIGSGLVIRNGIEPLMKLNTVPVVILSDTPGLECLLKTHIPGVSFIMRPIEIEGIPDMIKNAILFMDAFKEDGCIHQG